MAEEKEEKRTSITPTPLDLPAFLPFACKQLETEFQIKITIEIAEEYENVLTEKSKKMKGDKALVEDTTQVAPTDQEVVRQVSLEVSRVEVTAVLDRQGHLLELYFYRTNIPRLLLKIISLCLPYQPNFNKIKMIRCGIDGYGIYEINKYFSYANLTEICLDRTAVAQRNYAALLDCDTRLNTLWLDRCGLLDRDCISLASKLAHPLPASQSLTTLSLAGNFISDEGAAALGNMLRSNRTLHHLNLCGNLITNSGAAHILDTLMPFQLTSDEIVLKRSRNFQYIKARQEVYAKCYLELINTDKTQDDKTNTRKKYMRPMNVGMGTRPSILDANALRAQIMTDQLVGEYFDPFSAERSETRESFVYCTGNLSLCYLNLAYNRLGYKSLVHLVKVLQYQVSTAGVGSAESGLLRVVVEGNPLPCACRELAQVDAYLHRVIAARNAVKMPRKSDKIKTKFK